MYKLSNEEKNIFLKRMLKETSNDDTEIAHSNADDILCEILQKIGGFDEILKAYDSVTKWYA